jgi:hypothetical protein
LAVVDGLKALAKIGVVAGRFDLAPAALGVLRSTMPVLNERLRGSASPGLCRHRYGLEDDA